MNDINRGGSNGQNRRRPNKNIYTTKSGKTIKLHQSLGERMRARKNFRAATKATYLSTLPKNPVKRMFYRMHPKRFFAYWFSREGGIMALKATGIGIIVCFFLAVGVFAYFRKDLPKIKDLSGDKIGGSITYYDRTGETVLWQDYGAVKRVPVPGDQITDYMRKATIAIEDKDYYKHGAFDVRGILRAGVTNVAGGSAKQGGSTITQQLVKINQKWTNERSLSRKVKELILAVELERQYSKADILNGYLNIAPYGGVNYGVETAARDYFGISAKDLTLAQSAMLASIPKAPTAYSPYSDPRWNPSATDSLFDEEALIGRQHYILKQMADQRLITGQEAEAAKKVDILAQVKPLVPKYSGIKSPYFVLAAKKQLEQKYGAATVDRGGWKVVTTMDSKLQATAEDLVAKNLANAKRAGADNEAIVAEDVQTGQIVSLVGGTDFNNTEFGQNNFASGILLPPGSSFKPYDYAALIDNSSNVGAGSVFYDTQGAIPGYPCTQKRVSTKEPGNCLQNYDFGYPGPVTLRYALGGSRNVPAVKAMLSAVPNDNSTGRVNSINKVISTASAMMANPYVKGNTYNCYSDEALTSKTQCYGASAIGDGAFLHLDDHVNGLSTLARLGNAIPRTYILKITDAGGKTVDEFKQPAGKQVIKADTAYIVNDMASDANASYLPAAFKFQNQKNGWKFAVKTGTTNDGYDGLMTSWSSKYAVVTWVGHHERNVTLRSSMETLTSPLARGWMEAAHADLKPVAWTKPAGLKTLPAYTVRNKVSRLGEVVPSPTNDLFPSWYQPKSTSSTSQTTDRVSSKVATSCTPELARQTASNSNAAGWNIDLWNGGSTSSTNTAGTSKETDDVHSCNDSPPSITITSPANCDADDGGCTITATASQGTHALTDPARAQFPGTVNFLINGQVVKTANVSDSPSTVSFQYTPTENGNITITAQAIDSVLYQATDSANFTAVASNVLSITSPTKDGNVSGNVTVSWSGGKPGYIITVTGNGKSSTKSSPGNSITFNDGDIGIAVLPVSYTATVTAADGKTSSVTFKRKS
ncbi:MAG TPA: transglycosylase domain-containing protein [Candidatus Saccharimonadales bacterium]|jgi:penicillin-binding protein 1A